jgi:hypothetical protein
MNGRSLAVGGVALAVLALLATPAASAPSSRPGAVILDARSGRILARVPIDDLITSAVPDGRGGWYVGGFFTRIGGQPRRGLAHLLPNGAIDPRFRVPVANSRGNPVSVRALARGGELLYVGCACGLVGGLRRPGLTAIDLRTRAVIDSFEPGTWTDIDRLAVTGERLLVARSCCTYPVPGIAALDLRTGAVNRSWNAGFQLIGDASVFNALVVRGSRVFAAGTFRVSGLPRNGLVALDPRTGAVDRSWRPARGGQRILTIALAGGRLYLGAMNGLLALDAETGAAVRAPKVPFREVFPLVPSGRRLLVGGR